MNSTLLRALAALLAIGAIVTAWIGYRLSIQPPVLTQSQPPPALHPMVVATRDIPAGELLGIEDVRVESVAQPDPRGYSSVHAVIGKLTANPVTQDTPIVSSHFPVLGVAAQSLNAGERGVAVKVNEVIGVGGFISPGDHVDVLLYLRAERETGDVSSAQIVLRDVRVVAYGDAIGKMESATVQALVPDNQNRTASDKVKTPDAKKGKVSKSAILAVPEKDAARLLLAESVGILRLALRGAEPAKDVSEHEARHFTRLDEIAGRGAPSLTLASKTPAASNQASSNKAPLRKREQVVVHQGDRVEVINIRQ